MTLTLKDILTLSGHKRSALEVMISHGIMQTTLKPAENGRSRQFSRDNALELCFMAAVMSVEKDLSRSAIAAGQWLAMEKKGALPPYWFFNPRFEVLQLNRKLGGQRLEKNFSYEELKYMHPDVAGSGWEDEFGRELVGKPASSILIIALHEIRNSVDKALDDRVKA